MSLAGNELIATMIAVCFAAGLNVYATVGTLGLLGRANVLVLPPQLAIVANDWVIGACLVLFVVEFFADKIPFFDLFWNVAQTFVRVPVAAVLAWSAAASLSPANQLIAALGGAGIAAIAHGGKLAMRGAATSSPEPFSNIILSLIEDGTAIALTWFAMEYPYLAAAMALGLLVVTFFIVRWTWRLMRASGRRVGDWLRKRPSAATVLLLLTTAAVQVTSQAPSLTTGVESGSHPVGFRIIVGLDESRSGLVPGSTRAGRQIPIAIWYPASSNGRRMQLRDYVVASEEAVVGTTPAKPADAIDAFVGEAVASGRRTRASLDPLLNATMLAARNAAPAKGRFPLVMFAHGSVHTASVMCEYLASHGFVVAAVQSKGATEIPYRLSRVNLDAMVSDLEFAAARLSREPFVAEGPIGVVGMSNGAIGGMALQLARKVAVVVSLDGGIGEDAGGTYLAERSSSNPRAFTAPLLHFYTADNKYLNLQHIRSYQSSSRTLVTTRGLRHADFLAFPVFDRIAPGFSGASPDALPGYQWISRYTLRFLETFLRESPSSRIWIASDPSRHGIPAGLLTFERLPRR